MLDHTARISGCAAPQRHELTGKDGTPLTLVQLLEAVGPIPDEGAMQMKKGKRTIGGSKGVRTEVVSDPVLFDKPYSRA